MNTFASGWKRNYYGKGDTIVYRLQRDGGQPHGHSAIFGANVLLLIYGDAFWATYTTGDNSRLIATDSMKNFIQRETLHFEGNDYESYCRFLLEKFLHKYPRVEGAQLTAVEIPYAPLPGSHVAYAPTGPDRAMARMEMRRTAHGLETVELTGGVTGFRLVRLGGSAFHGFVRDEYTTLPDIRNRPLHMWLDLEWSYTSTEAGFTNGETARRARALVHDVFHGFESGSIQEIIYQLGNRMLAELPEIEEVKLEANNRTWDAVLEEGDSRGTFTDARPPYGCLGLRLRRTHG
ncbi:MAG: urate oxidase [Candidatus Solibacter usitatus]|nr:urate oxidase [Candidatus Solibacter usitatus]